MGREREEPTRRVPIPVSLVPQVEQFISQGGVGCPFYEPMVPAGFPSPAQDENIQTLNILSYLIPYPERTVLIRVPDDSMEEDEGFFRGDILVAERHETPRNGDLVFCIANGEIFLTRFESRIIRRETPDAEIYAVVRFRIHTLHGDDFFRT